MRVNRPDTCTNQTGVQMSASKDQKSVNILIAEDDEINREVIGSFLQDVIEFNLTTVEDGRAALEAATTTLFDVLIFDQNMPFITGDRVIRHLRASNSINARTPAIRLSADTVQVSQQALAGVRTVMLPKPLRRDELVNAIWAILIP
jgi:CheY-like chemotaxis protein